MKLIRRRNKNQTGFFAEKFGNQLIKAIRRIQSGAYSRSSDCQFTQMFRRFPEHPDIFFHTEPPA